MRQTRALAALILLLYLPLLAAPKKKAHHKKELKAEITAILNQPELTRAHWGLDAVDLETGKVIFQLNQGELFMPASNAKLFTTAAALAIAGPDYRFHTMVKAEGKIDDNGRLKGDLVIVGGGDPNISGRVLPYQLKTERTPPHTQILEDMADQVARSGLKAVEGDIIGDDTLYEPERYAEGWAVDDLQWVDGAPVSALSFNDNTIFVNIQPGANAGDKALVTVEPDSTYYELDNRVMTSAAGVAKKIGIHRDPGSKSILLWGSLPVGDQGLKAPLAIEDPAEFTALIFRIMLERRGITITGTTRARHGDRAKFYDQPQPAPAASPAPEPAIVPAAPAATAALAEHVSLPLLEDIRVTNKTSENLHAELALRLVGKLAGTGASFEGGSAAVKQFLVNAGIHDDEFVFLDGSGLSRRDLVTPAAVVQLLIYASHQPWGAAYEESLPVSGADGSLSDRFVNTPAGGLIHAKTGTLSHVNSLSGYGQTRKGKRFVFSIFCNNHNLPNAKTHAAIDAIVQALVNE